ncbi:MAG: phosphate acyltransferase PlsX [Candidatus Melainabacteria bacterium]|nr:phosphate acyltransferase PlsX [Candidatus Melainabacteria bacterium]MBI3308366.1 phosphate acyltransferase PlsX [Candidatus Melainabacteria bacterium]
MTSIAVDAMGGDHAPLEIIHGAVLAAQEFDVSIKLIGPESILQKELQKYSINSLSIDIIPASDVIPMGEHQPASAVRKKPNSSIVVAMNEVAKGNAGGIVAAGSTGAATAAALFCLKRIPGIERPCIAAVMPTMKRPVVLADAGANLETTKNQMVQNAIMGKALYKALFKEENPRVGLLNVGEEEGKGTSLLKDVYQELKKEKMLNFIGNVQGRDVPEGDCDVCVCDGFAGNVFLKTTEGVAKMVVTLLRNELTRDVKSKVGAILAHDSFYRLRKRIDYSEYGGAQLLGVKGVCVIAHGSSQHIAIKNAIKVAKEAVEANIVGLTEDMVRNY